MSKAMYEVEFEARVTVEFSDHDKAKKFFIGGEWSKTFWDLSDMEELTQYIASTFIDESVFYNKDLKKLCKSLEGFGVFEKDEKSQSFTSISDLFGAVTVEYVDLLEPIYSSRVDNGEESSSMVGEL